MQGVKGSVSSHTHGWDKSSSSILDFCFFDLDFQCPPSSSLLSENVFAPHEGVPSCLLNTPPSLLLFPSGLCLRNSDLSRLIREKTLARSGLSNVLPYPAVLSLGAHFQLLLATFGDNTCRGIPEGLRQIWAHSGSLSGRSETLFGQGSAVIVTADADYPPWTILEGTNDGAKAYEIAGLRKEKSKPPGFHDPEYPAKVYKVEKAMYGLHQAPRATMNPIAAQQVALDNALVAPKNSV
nr:reverse transcriptase [Tanacetum cinerariifolium]